MKTIIYQNGYLYFFKDGKERERLNLNVFKIRIFQIALILGVIALMTLWLKMADDYSTAAIEYFTK
jgi:hypothetical protein